MRMRSVHLHTSYIAVLSVRAVNVDGDDVEPLKLGPLSDPGRRPAGAAARLARLEVEAGEENMDVRLDGQTVSASGRRARVAGHGL